MTFIPYHLDLIDNSMLTESEIHYLNLYNERIIELYGDKVSSENSYFWKNTKFIDYFE